MTIHKNKLKVQEMFTERQYKGGLEIGLNSTCTIFQII